MKVLLAVDETKGSKAAVEVFKKVFSSQRLEKLILLTVQKMEGKSVMDDLLLSDSEINELREALKGTEYQEILDRKSRKIIEHYENELSEIEAAEKESTILEGHPAEEILKLTEDEGVDLIVIGSRGGRKGNFLVGSVSREVINRSNVPVLVGK
ncbi:MAG: universal stress protein [Nitrospirae bacterium]|nr:MAG: universal stress protein [Nitrospirota bacterium]